jgi:haloalkane dehalogenase
MLVLINDHYQSLLARRTVLGMQRTTTTWLFCFASALGACQATAPDSASKTMPTIPASVPAPSSPTNALQRTQVLDSFMTFRELGSGPSVAFLHGNPTYSRVWRDVMPHVAGRARCLAPDLIGMGDSGKPDIAYRFADHARYLDAWFDALALRDLVLVGYDWGGALAMDWAARHPDRVRGLVLFETFLRPMEWKEWTPQGAELFRALRTPGVGEKMVLEENQFLARSLANGSRRRLDDAERAAYYAPYPDAASRRPLLQWPREIPIEGEPADVSAVVTRYDTWLASSPSVPKLLLTFQSPPGLQPSPTGSPAMIDWARANISNLEIAELSPAGHHAAEDVPHEIGRAVADWLERHALSGHADKR